MGHLAKSDGRVSEDEIELAKRVMAQMQLEPEQRQIHCGLARMELRPVILVMTLFKVAKVIIMAQDGRMVSGMKKGIYFFLK